MKPCDYARLQPGEPHAPKRVRLRLFGAALLRALIALALLAGTLAFGQWYGEAIDRARVHATSR